MSDGNRDDQNTFSLEVHEDTIIRSDEEGFKPIERDTLYV